MNTKQEAKFGMHSAVLACLEEKRNKWEHIPAFVRALTGYKERNTTVAIVIKEKARKLAGVATSKKKKKTQLREMALTMSGGLVAFANATDNDELAAAMKFTSSELDKTLDNELSPVCAGILDEVNKYKKDLEEYNIGQDKVNVFESLIKEFAIGVSAPTNARSAKKVLGTSLQARLTELSNIAEKQLDPLMLTFKDDDPEFFEEYHSNRIIIDPKTSSTQYAGVATDSKTNKPVKNVLVSVVNTNYVTNAKVDGRFRIRVPKPGENDLLFEVDGYEPLLIKAALLKLGKTTEVNAVMVKL